MTLNQEMRAELCRRIVELVHPVKIILFGSYASGDATADSDLDLLVIQDRVESKRRASVALWRALRDIPLSKDIVVATPEEYDFYRHEPGSVMRTASEKGVVLYAR
jgi:predicted nucleotidyltransferase